MKRIILLGVIFCFVMGVRGQDYYHAAGLKANIGLFYLKYNQFGASEASIDGGSVPGLYYKAMLGFDIDRNSMLIVGAHPFLGVSGVLNSRSGVSDGAGVAFELPLVCEYLIGDIEEDHFSANVGLSFLAMATTDGSGTVFGPRIGFGGQMEIKDNYIGAEVAFLYGLNKRSGFDPTWVITKQQNLGISFGLYYTL